MKSVRINGENTEIKSDSTPRLVDLVELIKTSIDPDHMITSLVVDGRDLEDSDWTANIAQFETSILEVFTGPTADFVKERMQLAPEVVKACFEEFKTARELFQDGKMQDGNNKMVEAVTTLQAFFEWFGSMLELMPEEEREHYQIRQYAEDMTTTCRKICQQQLYQSWWALGETIKDDLEPKLGELESRYRSWL